MPVSVRRLIESPLGRRTFVRWNASGARSWCVRPRALLADWREAMSEMRGQQDRLVSDGLWVTGPSDFLDIIGRPGRKHPFAYARVALAADRPTRARLWACQAPGGTLHGGVRCQDRWRSGGWRSRFGGTAGRLTSSYGARTSHSSSRTRSTREQPEPVRRFVSFKNENAPLFMFLTPDGRKPDTATTPDAQRAFQALSWPEVRAMLEAALDESAYDRRCRRR